MARVGSGSRSRLPRLGKAATVASKRKGDPAVYVRFVCSGNLAGKRSRLGLFTAISQARENAAAPEWARSEVGKLYGWFQNNLAFPDKFAASGHKGFGQPGLSWFRAEAVEHIQTMHRLKLALEECGVHVDVFTTRDPGEIIYRDAHQIVADPGSRRFRS